MSCGHSLAKGHPVGLIEQSHPDARAAHGPDPEQQRPCTSFAKTVCRRSKETSFCAAPDVPASELIESCAALRPSPERGEGSAP